MKPTDEHAQTPTCPAGVVGTRIVGNSKFVRMYVLRIYLEAARGGLVGRLVVPSDEVHLLREGRLEGDKVQGDLAREEPPVHVVAQEKVLPVGRLRKASKSEEKKSGGRIRQQIGSRRSSYVLRSTVHRRTQ